MHRVIATRSIATAVATGLVAALFVAAPAQAAKTVVTMNTVQIFGTIDPAKITDYTEYMAGVNLYDGLIGVDSQGHPVAHLATRWDVSPDAKVYTFHLKPDATFQDGVPVTAEDVVYSVQRLLKINLGPAYLFSDVLRPDAVTALDPHTVRFTLTRTYSPFMAVMPLLLVVDKKLVEANAKDGDLGQDYLASHSAGAGPYRLESWDRGARMIITRYPGYHMGWKKGAIDEVRFILTNDEATVRSLAASGELTMTSQYQASETYDALAKMPRMKVVEKPTTTAFYLKLNTRRPPTDDIHVRKAIACATDYDTIRSSIVPGGVLEGPLPSGFTDSFLKGLTVPKLDMDCAAAELQKSKYAGQKIPLDFVYVSGTKFEEEIGLLMKAQLEPLNFQVNLRAEPWNRVTEIASKVETTPNVTEVFFGPTYPSPDSMFFTQYDAKAKGTWASMEWLADLQIDRMIEDARNSPDKAEQVKLYQELQRRIVELQPDAFLMTQSVRHAMDKCLDGFEPIPMQSFDYDFWLYHWTCAPQG